MAKRLMKEGLGASAVARMVKALERSYPAFDGENFACDVFAGIKTLELKARVHFIAHTLANYLPPAFPDAAGILLRIKHHWDGGDANDPLRGFAAWPLIDYVGLYGVQDPHQALAVLHELTELFSAEFAIRPFITQHEKLTLTTLQQWCDDANPHVRRLVSEGLRPRLPWGGHLPKYIANPKPVLALLEKLKDDDSDYVRRSVANNLNDIAKDNPQSVIATCQRWLKHATPQRRWIVQHATRTLVKQGDAKVLKLLGFDHKARVSVTGFKLKKSRVRLGQDLQFEFAIRSTATRPQALVVDYVIHHCKHDGQRRGKVFKLKKVTVPGRGMCHISKSHALRHITTRKYYSGEHVVEILINGRSRAKQSFHLRTE